MSSGRWKAYATRTKRPHSTARRRDCCGQVVAKRLWVVEVEGEERRFCGPDCEKLYREYVVPRKERTL